MPSTLRFLPYEMPAASLGADNPLPDMRGESDAHASIGFDETIPEEERASFTYGRVTGILPYKIQDGYDRAKKPRAFDAAVLENDHLRATFLPELGGRLWSLYDKDAGRDLLHVNPVFQPANLALRNAWISGGVEWNIGMIGHTPFTVSPMFATAYKRKDGLDALRMYEWERIRGAAYSIEAFLPEDSRFLFVRVEIMNTRDEETPMYWWSNTAVNEAEGVRVIAPADQAFAFDYTRTLTKQDVPIKDGLDRSYTTRVNHAMDLFFDIKKGQRKWECAVDERGYGLMQASTDRLRGRKLFMWGKGPGGKRWQEFLAAPGHAYLEIQAGIAQTQMQCLPMPAKAKWDWLEAYGAISADPKAAHGEWKGAYDSITRQLDGMLPLSELNAALERAREESKAIAAPTRMGSGWAALEAARLSKEGKRLDAGSLDFADASMGEEQAPWLSLLNTGVFPKACPKSEPVSYMTQPEWAEMLSEAAKRPENDHWLTWLHVGIQRRKAGDAEGAIEAFERSDSLTENAWAKRNIAMVTLSRGDGEGAARKLMEAARLLPHRSVALECGKLLLSARMYAEFGELRDGLPAEITSIGRFRVMEIEALIELGEYARALEAFGEDLDVNDVREGEVLLSDLWIRLHKKTMIAGGEAEPTDEAVLKAHPLPHKIDFRMRT